MRSRRVARRGAVVGCLTGLVLGMAVPAQLPAVAADPPANQVTVSTGALRGAVNADRRAFLGIPYAAPPTGERRFRPPQPAASWSGTRNATSSGNDCPQSPSLLPTEDCLYLDVYTPPTATGTANLPVMVWIHGGGYVQGAASGFDPQPLIRKGVVVVELNYRLGAFGFLGLPGLKDESRTTGNYGILDQQAGLRWVKQNIAAFGGNPNNVTIFGESAGGHSVCMQLISPQARGLFHKAISESGGCVVTGTGKRAGLGPVTLEQSYASGRDYAAKVGCTDPATLVSCLRGKSVNALLDKSGGFADAAGSWAPAVDGTVITETTDTAMKAGRYAKVPLISGTNKDEGRFFVALQYHLSQFRSAKATELTEWVRDQAGEVLAPTVLDRYRPASADNADLALSAAMTDSMFACAADVTSRAAAASQTEPVYQYEFSDPNPPLSGLDPFMNLGDYHASELFYLFSEAQGIPLADAMLTATQKKLSAQMVSYWTNFAKTGDPNGGDVPNWPALTDGADGKVQRLTSEGVGPFAASTFSANHNCDLWNKFAN